MATLASRKPARRSPKAAAAAPDGAAAAASPTTPLVTLVVLKGVLGHVGATLSTLRTAFGDTQPLSRKASWRSHIPQLARAGADMIDLEPKLFSWLSFTAETLRHREAEVMLLTELKAFLDRIGTFVSELLAARRDDLYNKTSELTSGLSQGLASPLTPADVRRRLEEISAAVRALVEEQNSAVVATRRANLGRVAELDADRQRLAEENAVLKGASAPAAFTAPRRVRRARRTRR